LAKILVIEDEENLRFTIKRALAKASYSVIDVANLADARVALAQHDFDLILTDVFLGQHDNGLEFVRELRSDKHSHRGTIVVMTAFSSVENAVAAMRDGADDYIQKPISLEELGLQVARWIQHRKLAQRVELYERLEKSREQDQEVLGSSQAWRNCLAMADRLAAIPLPASSEPARPGLAQPMHRPTDQHTGALPCILLSGETGAGKGVLARYIHGRAIAIGRAAGAKDDPPLVHVNCSALPATLVESELFGHEKGAFTDARESRTGLFEMADGGTIFLDEVSETPLEFQAKLLTVLEHGTFRRVGGSREKRVRVRVVAASNQNLEQRVQAGTFRRDLLYRLNAFQIRIPALRERNDDSVVIAEALVSRISRRFGKEPKPLSHSARAAILTHSWPGNVRELANAVQRAVMLSDGMLIEAEDLGLTDALSPVVTIAGVNGIRPLGEPSANEQRLDSRNDRRTEGSTAIPCFDFVNGIHTAVDVEKELIKQALKFTRGNVSKAAKLINMQRSSIRYRIERYGLDRYVLEVANL
jgi:DNA-binding NtrC family response regulator